MIEVWDSDTGTVTIDVTTGGAAVDLSGATSRVLHARNRGTEEVTPLTIDPGSDLVNGKVTTDVQVLPPGEYDLILRATDVDGTVTTYPSADVGPARLTVRADVDT